MPSSTFAMSARFVLPVAALALATSSCARDEAPRPVYKIALGCGFPPWNAPCTSDACPDSCGDLEGAAAEQCRRELDRCRAEYDFIEESFDAHLIRAACSAARVICTLEERAYVECLDFNASPQAPGAALLSGSVDGCATWSSTPDRRILGFAFTVPYTLGAPNHLLAHKDDARFSTPLAPDGAGSYVIGYTGFANDVVCLRDVLPSANDGPVIPEGQSVAEAMQAGTIDLFFGFANIGYQDTKIVNADIPCGGLTVMTYPDSADRKKESKAFERAFAEGFSEILANGTYHRICKRFVDEGHDPQCLPVP